MSVPLMPYCAFIAFGSNLGDRGASIAAAVAALAARDDVRVLRVATVIETEPVDCPPGSPPFLNTAAAIETSLEPLALLRVLRSIERDLGRVRSTPNAARPIDLDLLLYDDRVIETAELTVPHPRMHERAFVLAPLAEIAEDVVHPVLRRTIRDLASDLRRP